MQILEMTGTLTPNGTLTGEITAGGGGGGGTDNLPAVVFGTNTTPTINCPDAEHKTFKGLFALTEVTLPDATAIAASAFANFTALQKVTAPEVVTVGQQAFYKCTGLTEVSLPRCVTIGRKAFNEAFSNGAQVSLSLPECTTISEEAFSSARITALLCPNVTTVGSNIIRNTSITSISLPLVTALPNEALQNADRCATVNLPNCETIGENALSSMALTDIDLPKVRSIGKNVFDNNEGLHHVRFGYDGVVALPTLEEWEKYNLFAWRVGSVTIHVPAGQLANYQADTKWQKVVAEGTDHSYTVTFVGDYA